MAEYKSDSSNRPFSVIPQSLRDAAAFQAAQRRRTDVADEDARIVDSCNEGGSCASDAVPGQREGSKPSCSAAPLRVDRYGIPENATPDERLAYVQRMMEREVAARASARHPREKSPLHGVLQGFVDSLFEDCPDRQVKRLDVVVAADSSDLPQDLMEIIELLPPGTYTRQRLCGQLNSAIGAHAWSHTYGMVR